MASADPSAAGAHSSDPNDQKPLSPAAAAAAAAAGPGPGLQRSMLQSMPDTRQQSFDEIYGPPENFLEIEVRLLPRAWFRSTGRRSNASQPYDGLLC